MNVAVIIGKIDLKENVFTILAKNGTPIYIPIIIGIYHILVIDEFLNNNNSFIKSTKLNTCFNTNTSYILYIISQTSLTAIKGSKFFL